MFSAFFSLTLEKAWGKILLSSLLPRTKYLFSGRVSVIMRHVRCSMKRVFVLGIMIALLLVIVGCKPAASAQPENKTVVLNETLPVEPVVNVTKEPEKPKVSLSATGGFVAAIKVKNAESLTDITSLNVTFKKVDIQPKNATLASQWVKIFDQKATTNLITLGDDAFELGLNSVPVQEYKALRVQIKTGGDAATESALTSYSIPYDFVQVLKPFSVGPDEILTLVFEIDLARSATVLDGNVLLKPEGVFTLLKGAKTTRKGGGIVTIEGGEEIYSVDLTYEKLLPPGTLEEAVADCKEDCPDSCLSKSESCRSECVTSVKVGCAIGGDDCRDKCDPYVSAFICRDNCEEESESTCESNLVAACGTECEKKYSDPCVKTCETACSS